MSRKISFTVKTEEIKEVIDNYAKEHGCKGASDLARIAVYEYMRLRTKKAQWWLPDEL